jgi:hypothetical protein
VLRPLSTPLTLAGEDRRGCGVCGARACVTADDVDAWFCLACRAIFVDDVWIDIRGRVTPGPQPLG